MPDLVMKTNLKVDPNVPQSQADAAAQQQAEANQQNELNKAIELAKTYSNEYVIEEFISGREICCAIHDFDDNKLTSLPLTEVLHNIAGLLQKSFSQPLHAAKSTSSPCPQASLLSKNNDHSNLIHSMWIDRFWDRRD